MSERVAAVLQAALELTEDERGELIDRIFDSLSPDDGGDLDEAAFLAELERRCRESVDGSVAGVPQSEVDRMMQAEIDASPRR